MRILLRINFIDKHMYHNEMIKNHHTIALEPTCAHRTRKQSLCTKTIKVQLEKKNVLNTPSL